VLKTNLKPSEKHLYNIKNWLIDEWNKTDKGFYSNWDIISEAFTNKRLSVITENDIAIGFIVYRTYDRIAVIDITEIKPNERKKGLAKKLVNETLDFFKSTGVLAVELYCSPKSSKCFWERIGFENFSVIPYDTKINMFKPLVEILEQSDKQESNVFKLWNCECHEVDDFEAKWFWKLQFKEDNVTLVKPIIFPAFYRWQVELIINERNFKDEIKYFPLKIFENGTFIVIDKIKI